MELTLTLTIEELERLIEWCDGTGGRYGDHDAFDVGLRARLAKLLGEAAGELAEPLK